MEIDGSYDGQTVMGVANTWAYLKAISFEETTYEESFGKANTTWEFSDKIIDQNGMSVSITKVEFASDETRVYITATNNSADSFNLWSSSCKVIQNGTQYEQSFSNYMADYPQISSEILPDQAPELFCLINWNHQHFNFILMVQAIIGR